MSVEDAQYIFNLDKKWPLSDDGLSEGDDHLRVIKKAIKQTFPGETGEGYHSAILATELDLNFCTGISSNVQDQIDAKPDHSEVVLKSGDTMTGQLNTVGVLGIHAREADVQVGVETFDPSGDTTSAFNYYPGNYNLEIYQVGALRDRPDTLVRISDGKVNVTTLTGKQTDAETTFDLTNKRYVDEAIAAAVSALQAQINVLNGG